MLKKSGWLFSLVLPIATSVGALAATGAPTSGAPVAGGSPAPSAPVSVSASANIVQPLEDKQRARLVTPTRLKIEAVTSRSVCGTSMASPESRFCLGENSGVIASNETVGKVQSFIIGQGNLCGVDERGVRCWATEGTFEKPVQEILKNGDSSRVRFGNSKICLPKSDKKIYCYAPEQGEWVPGENGKENRFVRAIPPVEIYGPYADLRDFRVTEAGLCLLNGDRVICEKSPQSENASPNVDVPQNSFKGARSIVTIWGNICVLSSLGLDCVRGTGSNLLKYHVDGTWLSAVRLFEGGYDSICAVDKDEKPMCVKLGEKEGETVDVTPSELLDPSIRVIKFRASGDSRCALVEKTSSLERSLLCSSYGKLETVQLGGNVADFEVGVDAVCVRNAAGIVSCFRNGDNLASPLPEDGSISHTAGPCRWNNSRFHCASTEITTDFSDIKTVLGVSPVSDDLPLPCLIFENQSDVRSLRCFGTASRLATNAPALRLDNVNIAATSSYACAYGSETTECWGAPLGGVVPPNLSSVQKMLFGQDFGCAKDQFGFVCWGRDLENRGLAVPRGLVDLDSVSDFAIGAEHVCAMTREKTISCWGNNRDGQLDAPTLVDPVSISAGGNTTCATAKNGVTCWGVREAALLGSGQLDRDFSGKVNRE